MLPDNILIPIHDELQVRIALHRVRLAVVQGGAEGAREDRTSGGGSGEGVDLHCGTVEAEGLRGGGCAGLGLFARGSELVIILYIILYCIVLWRVTMPYLTSIVSKHENESPSMFCSTTATLTLSGCFALPRMFATVEEHM